MKSRVISLHQGGGNSELFEQVCLDVIQLCGMKLLDAKNKVLDIF